MESRLKKLAFHSERTGGTYLLQDDLQNLIKMTSKQFSNLPVGVVAVFGCTNNFSRKLYTDWLIQYLESSPNKNIVEGFTQQRLKFLQRPTILTDGVYFWPRFYKSENTDENGDIFRLLLYIEGDSRVDLEFAENVCSQAITVSSNIEKQIADLDISDTPCSLEKNGHIFNVYIEGSPEKSNVQSKLTETELKQNFFKALGTWIVPAKKTSTGCTLLLNDVVVYFKRVLEVVKNNAEATLFDNLPKTHDTYMHNIKQTNKGETYEDNSLQKKADDTKAVVLPTRKETIAYCIPKGSTENQAEKMFGDKNRCLELNCKNFQIMLLRNIFTWLDSQTFPWNIEQLREYVHKFKNFDQHNQLEELEYAFKSTEAYFCDLKNIFDNHICFYGSQNESRFTDISKNIYGQNLLGIKTLGLVHLSFANEVFKKCCESLHNYFVLDNFAIYKHEEQLANIVLSTVHEKYKQELERYAQSYNLKFNYTQLTDVNYRLQNYFVKVLDTCLESGARLNQIQTTINKKVSDLMNRTFQIYQIEHMCKTMEVKGETSIKSVILAYQKLMHEVYEAPLRFLKDQILEHHENSVISLLSTFKSDEFEIVETILNGHLNYIIAVRHELKEPRVPHSTNPLCLRLTSDRFRIDVCTNNGHQILTYEKEIWAPAFIAYSNSIGYTFGYAAHILAKETPQEITFCGSVEQFLNCLPEDLDRSKCMLENYFDCIKTNTEYIFAQPISSILVPVWYGVESRIKIQKYCEKAGFADTFVVADSAAAAFEIFHLKPENVNQLVVPVCVSHTHVQVEIYKAGFTTTLVVQLVALARVKRENFNDDLPIEKIYFEQVLDKALSQLPPEASMLPKICFSMTNSPEAKQVNEVLRQYENFELFVDEHNCAASNGAIRLSQNINVIRQQILDYIFVLDEHQIQNNDTCPVSCNSNKSSKKTNTELERQKDKMLRNCESIKIQMEKGKTRVRGILRKYVNETLERVEQAAMSDIYNLEELLVIEKEIIELVEEHEFELK